MDKLEIIGGVSLDGEISISGSKNAALPILAASLLSDCSLILKNVPELADIALMIELLNQHGCLTIWDKQLKQLRLQMRSLESLVAPYEIVRKMRASVLVLGPLLARYHEARVSLPGGCAIGTRPVDIHIKGLERLGAQIHIEEGYIHAKAPGGLKGAEIQLPFPSVGATENILMAATLAQGKTVIKNAAREPEVVDLANCLIAMGAQISGHGQNNIYVEGIEAFREAEHRILPDRIETGTYMMAAGITGGHLFLKNTDINLVSAESIVLEEMGIVLTPRENSIQVKGPKRLKPTNVVTAVFPGYATDLQAQIMALMCVADGISTVKETIFENRLMHVPELCRMGAQIDVLGADATVRGIEKLKAAEVMATDLRASVSLVLAALAAEGKTILNRVYHLDRGYENLEGKLQACGAKIRRIKGGEDGERRVFTEAAG